MEHYQQKRMKSFLLPEAVYRQALWAVKDVPRMKQELLDSQEKQGSLPSHSLEATRVSECPTGIISITERRAVKTASLSMKIDSIEAALQKIPEKYRNGIKDKLMYGVPYSDQHHSNTWKKWQQIFIYYVAENLGIY